ncbi:MAG: DUF4292 domain-containing protein [Bacteroidales bacterium]|nr:DUF4292 domain-containing protein [Bacteroidales bacterium]MCF8386451.1 DUF4292 domain-containing protein [Bacteroidales bacterium]MCF8397805.1 DUF4292 domain-containing protein [Bacteroidales bacterium]
MSRNRFWNTLLSVFILAGMMFTQHACKTTRSVIKKPIKEEGPDYLFDKLKDNELEFNWFSAKINIDLVIDKKKTSFKGQIRIKKDSLIWVSFTPALGIEVARLMISEDSVKYINRLNNTYFLGDYQFLNNFLETSIDFDVLQSFIIGNDFQYYEIEKFRASIDAMEYRLSTAARQKLKKYVKKHEVPQVFLQNIWLDPENFKITKVNIRELNQQNRKLEAFYQEFKDVEGQLFPSKMIFEISAGENILVDVNFSKIAVKDPLRFPFNIPGRYERIR